MEIQANKVSYTQNPTALEAARHIQEKKQVGILQDEKKIHHIVLIQETKSPSLKGIRSVLAKLRGFLQYLWDQFKEKILRIPSQKIHVTDLKNKEDAEIIMDLFKKALLKSPVNSQEHRDILVVRVLAVRMRKM